VKWEKHKIVSKKEEEEEEEDERNGETYTVMRD
jgi:hypothetical protein